MQSFIPVSYLVFYGTPVEAEQREKVEDDNEEFAH